MAHLLSTSVLLATPSSTNKENLTVTSKKFQQNVPIETRAFGTIITNQPSTCEKIKPPLSNLSQVLPIQESQWDDEFDALNIDFTYTSPTPAFSDSLTENVDVSKLRHPCYYRHATPNIEELFACDEISHQSDSQGAYFSSEDSIELPPAGFYTEPI